MVTGQVSEEYFANQPWSEKWINEMWKQISAREFCYLGSCWTKHMVVHMSLVMVKLVSGITTKRILGKIGMYDQ